MSRATTAAKAYVQAIATAVGGTVDVNDRVHVAGRRVALRMGATVDVEGSSVTFRPWADPVSEAIEAARAALEVRDAA